MEEVLASELLRLLATRYGATVVHLRRKFLVFPFVALVPVPPLRGSSMTGRKSV
jgi:hypothetical protein